MAAEWDVYADWDGDGVFTTWGDNITGRILDGRTQLSITYGKDQSRALSPTRVGDASFEVSNVSGDYSPELSTSPLYGKVLPSRPVKIEAVLNSTTYTPFRGRTDDFTVKLGADELSVDITCADGLSMLQGVKVTTGIYQGLRTGQALHVILDAIGWPVADRDIDVGATVMPHWWLDNTDAYEAAMELIDSEGPQAMITCNSAGAIVYRDRHHRSVRASSITSQATWYSRTMEPMFGEPAEYDHGWREIVNSVSFDVPMRAVAPSLEVVWSSPSRITIASGETLNVTVKGSSPFLGALTPVAGTDYTATGTVTVSMPRTSGESTTVALTAPSGVAYVEGLQVRGFLLQDVGSMVVSGEDASIGPPRNYGRRSSVNLRPPKWAGQYDAAAIVALILAQRAERLPTIKVTMVAANATRQLQQLSRDLSDRVRVTAYTMGLNADCFIEQITHTVSQGGLDHRTTFGLEKAPAQVAGAFVLGTSLLGTGVLGRRGFSDPDRIFTLGSATNGQLGNDILAA
jgi:hypothetical protein